MANLREEYKQHIHNTAPDMDKLWNRISEEIDKTEKNRETETAYEENRRQIKSSVVYTRIAAIAAAFIVVFAGVNIVNESNKAKVSTNDLAAEETDKMNGDKKGKDTPTSKAEQDEDRRTEDTDKPPIFDHYEGAEESDGPIEETVKYEQLSFNHTDTVAYMASYVPEGDEYFVEQSVLAQTDYFADVTVISAALGDDGRADYTLQLNLMYDKDPVSPPDSVIYLTSSTPYILQENREYLLPLSYDNGSYSIVFENAPQIEITLDGGMVFQNGWSSLDENAQTLEKDSLNVNDHYFDRMRYAPLSDLQLLLTEWNYA